MTWSDLGPREFPAFAGAESSLDTTVVAQVKDAGSSGQGNAHGVGRNLIPGIFLLE